MQYHTHGQKEVKQLTWHLFAKFAHQNVFAKNLPHQNKYGPLTDLHSAVLHRSRQTQTAGICISHPWEPCTQLRWLGTLNSSIWRRRLKPKMNSLPNWRSVAAAVPTIRAALTVDLTAAPEDFRNCNLLTCVAGQILAGLADETLPPGCPALCLAQTHTHSRLSLPTAAVCMRRRSADCGTITRPNCRA